MGSALKRIEDGGQQHSVFKSVIRNPQPKTGGFQRLPQIGHDPGADNGWVCGARQSKVVWFKAGMFGNAREHLRADLLAVMEGKHHIGPAVPRKDSMGSAALALNGPADAEQSSKNPARFA